MPSLLRWLVVLTIIGVVIACAVVIARPRGQTTTKRAKRETSARHSRREAELADLRKATADKPPYQPPTPGFPTTAGMDAISKLPGQDRLTRDDQGEQDVSSAAVPAAADDPFSGATPTLAQPEPPPLRQGDLDAVAEALLATDPSDARPPAPTHPATTAMPAVQRPAVPGGPAGPQAGPPAPAEPQPAPPAQATPQRVGIPLDPPRLPGETRAQRRARLAQEPNRPESPQDDR